MAGEAVVFSGPFFEKDPTKTFRVNVRAMLDGMVSEGEGAVRGIIAPHSKSGALAGSIHGRTRSLSGKPWALTGVISSNLNALIAASRGQQSGQWRGSYAGFIETGYRINDRVRTGSALKVSKSGKLRVVGVWESRKVRTSFRGYAMFRRTAAGLRNSRAAATADLAKGLT